MHNKTPKPTLRSTRNYSLFTLSDSNRSVSSAHIQRLKPSIEEYGWIPAFPMLVHRTPKGLEVKDGQHRFAIAQELGIAVWFVVVDKDFDVSTINAGQLPWKWRDYADSFARRGVSDYAEVLQFAETYRLTIGYAAALLGGQSEFSNMRDAWKAGEFKIKDRKHASKVAEMYSELRKIGRFSHDRFLFLALIAVARVDIIDCALLIRNAARIPERVVKFGTRDGALDMLEDIYNRFRRGKVPLKVHCQNAMNNRNACAKRA